MTLPDIPPRRAPESVLTGPRFQRSERLALSCPSCKLVIYPRTPTLAPQHCPRCLARRHVGVTLQETLQPQTVQQE